MRSITVLFKKEESDAEPWQLQVSLGMKVSDFIQHIVRHLKYREMDERGQPISYVLRAYPPGSGMSSQECVELHPDQTLADAGIVDGSRLVLSRRDSKARIGQPPVSSTHPFTTQDRVIRVSEWIVRVVEVED